MARDQAAAITDSGTRMLRSRPAAPRRRTGGMADRFTMLILILAMFLVVLAVLAWQLRGSSGIAKTQPVSVLRRIYETKTIETIPGPGSGPSVSQSVSSSGSGYTGPAPTTRSSSAAP